MSIVNIINEIDRQTEMSLQNFDDEGKKMNPGLCTSAGIKTPIEADQNRFQRRHFPNKTTSNIFFSDSEAVETIPSENNVHQDELNTLTEIEASDIDQEQIEKPHSYLSLETFIQPEDTADHNEQVDSAERSEVAEIETDDEDKKTQRRHFCEKTSSNIFFCGLPPEEIILNDRASPSDFRKRKSKWNSVE